MFEQGMLLLVGEAFLETLFMTLVSTFFAYVIGIIMLPKIGSFAESPLKTVR